MTAPCHPRGVKGLSYPPYGFRYAATGVSLVATVCAIVAMDKGRVIGIENRIPWDVPADMKRFSKLTTGHTVVMGRKTYASIGHALPDRTNIIVTHDTGFSAPDCTVVHSIEDAVQVAAEAGAFEVMFIGGAQLYKQIVDRVERMYLTRIHHQFAGDIYFPEYDETMWSVVDREDHRADDENKHDYTFLVLEPAVDF